MCPRRQWRLLEARRRHSRRRGRRSWLRRMVGRRRVRVWFLGIPISGCRKKQESESGRTHFEELCVSMLLM